MLGVQLDLRDARLGLALASSASEKVDEFSAGLDWLSRAGEMSKQEGECVRVRLQFANAQLFGKWMKRSLRRLSEHIASNGKALSVESLKLFSSALSANKARQVSRVEDWRAMCASTWMPLLNFRVSLVVCASTAVEKHSGLLQ